MVVKDPSYPRADQPAALERGTVGWTALSFAVLLAAALLAAALLDAALLAAALLATNCAGFESSPAPLAEHRVHAVSIEARGVSVQFREVSFDTADGGRIVGNRYPARPAAGPRRGDPGTKDSSMGSHSVVLAHGAVFNKESWDPLAKRLSEKGYDVLAIDFRAYGKSVPGTNERALYEDVLAAVRYVRREGAKTVSVVGASMGGGASARAAVAARESEIDRLILLSPVSIANPEAMRAGRVYFIASQDERLVPRLKEQFERAPDPKRLELLPGSAHAQHIFKTDQSDELTALIVEFLAEAS